MRDWGHGSTTNPWSNSLPTITTSLANHDTAMLGVPKHTNRCTATTSNRRTSPLGKEPEPSPFSGIQSRTNTSTPTQLATSTRLQLNIMDHSPGNHAQRHTVADIRLQNRTTFDICQPLSLPSQNVTLLTHHQRTESTRCDRIDSDHTQYE